MSRQSKALIADSEFQEMMELERKLMRLGRTSKYQEDYCLQLIEHMGRGKSYTTFAKVIETSPSVFAYWEKMYPEWLEAKNIATAYQLDYWEGVAMDSADGTSPKSNPASLIFMLKNLFPDKFMDKREEKSVGPATIILETGIDRGRQVTVIQPDKVEDVKRTSVEEALIIDNSISETDNTIDDIL